MIYVDVPLYFHWNKIVQLQGINKRKKEVKQQKPIVFYRV